MPVSFICLARNFWTVQSYRELLLNPRKVLLAWDLHRYNTDPGRIRYDSTHVKYILKYQFPWYFQFIPPKVWIIASFHINNKLFNKIWGQDHLFSWISQLKFYLHFRSISPLLKPELVQITWITSCTHKPRPSSRPKWEHVAFHLNGCRTAIYPFSLLAVIYCQSSCTQWSLVTAHDYSWQ